MKLWPGFLVIALVAAAMFAGCFEPNDDDDGKPTPTPFDPYTPTPTPTPTPEEPGFEAVLAIAGLLTVAILFRRRI